MASDVELRAVTKRFGSFLAVAGIDLDVERGQFVTLLGPSGCGKTTTLRMIGGFEWPDAGEIRVAGRPVGEAAGRHSTRMVFQSYALFPHKSVADNVAFGLRMARVPGAEIRDRVARMLGKLGLSDQAVKYPRQLSGGQQQRVALARALVTEPQVLLLDEPLGALDLKMRKHMQGELKSLQRDVGITFIYVTHDQEEAMNLSDLIVVMDRGRVAQIGSPEDVYRRPATAYVAGFVGETNLIPARLTSVEGEIGWAETSLGTLEGILPAGGRIPVGAAALLALRPESVLVGTEAAGLATARTGTVRSRSFLGPVTRIEIDIGGTSLAADLRGDAAAQPGDELAVAWLPRSAFLVQAGPGEPA